MPEEDAGGRVGFRFIKSRGISFAFCHRGMSLGVWYMSGRRGYSFCVLSAFRFVVFIPYSLASFPLDYTHASLTKHHAGLEAAGAGRAGRPYGRHRGWEGNKTLPDIISHTTDTVFSIPYFRLVVFFLLYFFFSCIKLGETFLLLNPACSPALCTPSSWTVNLPSIALLLTPIPL
ncbi:hypothetical protein VTJ04DRAFT_1675 [Mycothermus thermophilus]|uniref:uncharacterized protein n=1 Tax=Humicola insolens TaxID=85995 RepID=UPI00374404F4